MKKELFDELFKSVKQGSAIMKRTMKPARTFAFAEKSIVIEALPKNIAVPDPKIEKNGRLKPRKDSKPTKQVK